MYSSGLKQPDAQYAVSVQNMEKSILLLSFFLIIVCSGISGSREGYISNKLLEEEVDIKKECIETAKGIAKDSLNTDDLKSTYYKLNNKISGIIFTRKYKYKIDPEGNNKDLFGKPIYKDREIFIGINDNCKIDTIIIFDYSSENNTE